MGYFRIATIRFGFFLSLLAFATSSHAAVSSSNGTLITLQPILGYDFFYRSTPTFHKSGMLIYGARISVGKPHLAAEIEYTLGNDTEVFTSPSAITVNTQKQNLRLGGRLNYEVSSLLEALVRFGGEASKIDYSSFTLSGSGPQSTGSWDIHPYLGSGINLNVSKALSTGLTADYVFYSLSDFTQNSVRLTASLTLHFNNR